MPLAMASPAEEAAPMAPSAAELAALIIDVMLDWTKVWSVEALGAPEVVVVVVEEGMELPCEAWCDT